MKLKEYETICAFRIQCGQAEIDRLLLKLKPHMEKEGGALVRTQMWGRKRFAYLVGKEREGLYVRFHYAALPTEVTEIERIISFEETVLKSLTIKLCDGAADPARLAAGKAEEIPAFFQPDREREGGGRGDRDHDSGERSYGERSY